MGTTNAGFVFGRAVAGALIVCVSAPCGIAATWSYPNTGPASKQVGQNIILIGCKSSRMYPPWYWVTLTNPNKEAYQNCHVARFGLDGFSDTSRSQALSGIKKMTTRMLAAEIANAR